MEYTSQFTTTLQIAPRKFCAAIIQLRSSETTDNGENDIKTTPIAASCARLTRFRAIISRILSHLFQVYPSPSSSAHNAIATLKLNI